jgi:hypothetical protein
MHRIILKSSATLFFLLVLAAAQTIPSGSKLTIRMGPTLSSGTATIGEKFDATLASHLVVNGKTLARTGAPVRGKVTYVKQSGRLHEPGALTLRLTSVQVNGKMVPISTSSYRAAGNSHKKSNATKIGGGAGAGALIGAIAGGGKGAALGAVAGGAAGIGVAAATGKQEAVVESEAALTFTITTNAVIR